VAVAIAITRVEIKDFVLWNIIPICGGEIFADIVAKI
jgi:hypothetical protein